MFLEWFWSAFCQLFLTFWGLGGQFFTLFWDLGLTSVMKWGPGPNKVEKGTKTFKKGDQKGEPFHKNSMFFVMCFVVDFWRSLAKCFFAFWWPKCPKWELLVDTFPDMSKQRWKTENSGFVYTKHYFLEFWGAGFWRVGQLFSRSFLRWVWRHDFTIFWEIEGPAGSSKDVFWWAFQVQILHRCLMNFWWKTESWVAQAVVVIRAILEP